MRRRCWRSRSVQRRTAGWATTTRLSATWPPHCSWSLALWACTSRGGVETTTLLRYLCHGDNADEESSGWVGAGCLVLRGAPSWIDSPSLLTAGAQRCWQLAVRRGRIRRSLCDFAGAEADFRAVLAVKPTHAAAEKELDSASRGLQALESARLGRFPSCFLGVCTQGHTAAIPPRFSKDALSIAALICKGTLQKLRRYYGASAWCRKCMESLPKINRK